VSQRIILIVFIAITGASCRTTRVNSRVPPVEAPPPIVQPGAPGETTRVIAADRAVDLSQVQFIGADIKFMQGMISHHAQAVQMVALVPVRTTRQDIRALALRIDLSQQDEISMMQHWLELRGQPAAGAMHLHGDALMPGMLTPEEMAHLAEVKGDEFEQLFLLGMIKHHSGALAMVAELFASPGAGQEVEVFSFASDVDGDQRMEIDRMGAMLNAMVKERQE
jgi:uncharacterized protein (DUF305 family)